MTHHFPDWRARELGWGEHPHPCRRHPPCTMSSICLDLRERRENEAPGALQESQWQGLPGPQDPQDHQDLQDLLSGVLPSVCQILGLVLEKNLFLRQTSVAVDEVLRDLRVSVSAMKLFCLHLSLLRFHEDHLDLKESQAGMVCLGSQAHQDPQESEDLQGNQERKVTEDIGAALVLMVHRETKGSLGLMVPLACLVNEAHRVLQDSLDGVTLAMMLMVE